jgi:TolB-like protein/DNA-binding winged helix-turn-helix (wHTH) protein/Tfp pilus assembly protein PilF
MGSNLRQSAEACKTCRINFLFAANYRELNRLRGVVNVRVGGNAARFRSETAGRLYTDTVQAAETSASLLRFGAFELNLQTNELRRGGVLLKLSPQQLQALRLLVENAGQILTREQIQHELWGDGTFVDFDRNLNVCIAQIRATLNDDSDAPRYIQTVPKRGYRFIAPVERVGTTQVIESSLTPPRARWFWMAAATLLAACSMAVGYFAWRNAGRTDRVMLAMLPFENLSGDANEDLFTDGLTEELIGQFGSLNPERLGVIGRSSVMRYKGAPHGIDRVGRELGVDYVVEGTVRRSAGRVRVAARLIKVADQAQVWGDTSERSESEMFRMQEETAARITGAVAEKLLGGGTASAAGSHPHNQDAYQAYLNGRYLQHKDSREDLARSVGFFEKASVLDPQFDQAYSGAAETYVRLGRSGSPPQDVFPQARAMAEKALSINPSNAEAHNALANALFWYEWNWPSAEEHFKRAIAINSSFSPAYHDYAFFLIAMGRTEQGLSSLRRAIALDPLSARVNIDAGWLLLQAHRFDDAIRQARRALELEPGLAEANACIRRSMLYQRKVAPDPATAQKLEEAEKSGTGDPFNLAAGYAFLGQKDRALDQIENAFEKHSIMMPLLRSEPAFDVLHNEPRFQALARKLALP